MVKKIILSQQVEPSETSLESTSMTIYCDQTLESNGTHFDMTVDYFTLSIKSIVIIAIHVFFRTYNDSKLKAER